MQNRQDKPRVRLPFEPRRMDFGTWTYVHRAGVCAAVAVLLIFGIAFVAWSFDLGDSMAHQVIYVEMEMPEEMREPQVRELVPVDYGNISNRTSNENADAAERLRDAQGSELAEEAAGVGEMMDANRAAYEEGLLRNRQMIEDASRRSDDQGGAGQSALVQGNVTASYSFTDPVRHDQRLVIPAYRCMNDGSVVVAATLDQNGKVVSAEVVEGQSTPDQCLRREALAGARASRFNLDTRAPSRQRGTITYLFVRQ